MWRGSAQYFAEICWAGGPAGEGRVAWPAQYFAEICWAGGVVQSGNGGEGGERGQCTCAAQRSSLHVDLGLPRRGRWLNMFLTSSRSVGSIVSPYDTFILV